MSKIYNSIVDTVGNTPLVKINQITEGLPADIYLKCEFFNPLASVKDRIGRAMIEAPEAAGRLNANSVVVAPTSGNTGIALAFVSYALIKIFSGQAAKTSPAVWIVAVMSIIYFTL